MSRYGRVIEAAYVNVLTLHLMTLLTAKCASETQEVFPAAANTADVIAQILAPRNPLTLLDLEEVFDDALKLAEELGMNSGESKSALEQAFAKVLETTDSEDAELTLEFLLPAIIEYANKKKQGPNPVWNGGSV